MVQDGQRGTTTMADRAAEAQRATWVSVVVNLLLTVAQLVVGWLAHSQSLVAHNVNACVAARLNGCAVSTNTKPPQGGFLLFALFLCCSRT